MLIMNQNREALFDTTSGTLYMAYSARTKKYVVHGINNGHGSVEISIHDTEEEAREALVYIYAMASAKQPTVSMFKCTNNLEKEVTSAIIANSLAETCIKGGNENADNESES